MIAAAFFSAISVRLLRQAGSLIWESSGADAKISGVMVASIWALH